MNERQQKFAEEIADYIATADNYRNWTKRDTVLNTIGVLTGDIGAAQGFVNAIGLDVDLYETALLTALTDDEVTP